MTSHLGKLIACDAAKAALLVVGCRCFASDDAAPTALRLISHSGLSSRYLVASNAHGR